MDNIQAVQSLGANEIEKERFALASANSFRRERYQMLAQVIVGKLGETSGQFLYWALMLYMLGKVITGDMTPGDYAVVLGYFYAMSGPASALASIWIDLQGPAASARRVFAMLDMEQEKEVGTEVLPTVTQGISFQDVGFVYPDGRRALTDVTFEARVGEIVALAGPTGAGKTTFQETEFLPESIIDNIRYGKPGATMEEVVQVARTVGIHDFISELPDGYETQLGTTSSKLSVGQKQRIAIARGLIRDTPILILDEPTSALDPETETYLISALQEIARNRLVIIIAHRLSTITRADRIIFLEDGQIREQGSHTELMGIESGHYRRFVELQSA